MMPGRRNNHGHPRTGAATAEVSEPARLVLCASFGVRWCVGSSGECEDAPKLTASPEPIGGILHKRMCPNTAPILPAPGVGGSFFRAGPPWRLIPMHRILFVLGIVLSLLLVACSSPAQVATAPTAVPAQVEPAM